jgi:hypothetical protein
MGVLIGDYECASEVSGIQFNADLKQVATSHHDCPPEQAAAAAAAATHVRGGLFRAIKFKSFRDTDDLHFFSSLDRFMVQKAPFSSGK